MGLIGFKTRRVAGLVLGLAALLLTAEKAAEPPDFTLTEDLVLGLDPDAPLGRAGDVVVDSGGNLYILDAGFGVIHRFTGDGTFVADLGRTGEGPGEFEKPICLAVSPDDRIFVGGVSSRITILNADGTPAGEVVHVPLPVRSMCFDGDGNLYVASAGLATDPKDVKVIHKFDPDGKPLTSFGESGEGYKNQRAIIPSGFVAFGADGLLYYEQWAPQEVRTYTTEGTLVSTFPARSSESAMPEPKVRGDSVTFTVGNTSLRMLCLPSGHGFLTGLAYRDKDGMPAAVALDLYAADGKRVATHRAPGMFSPLALDGACRLYVSQERNDLPVVVRYRMELPAALR